MIKIGLLIQTTIVAALLLLPLFASAQETRVLAFRFYNGSFVLLPNGDWFESLPERINVPTSQLLYKQMLFFMPMPELKDSYILRNETTHSTFVLPAHGGAARSCNGGTHWSDCSLEEDFDVTPIRNDGELLWYESC